MEKVHCMSLSSIHIHYNHSPVQALSSLAGHCAPSVKFNCPEVVDHGTRGTGQEIYTLWISSTRQPWLVLSLSICSFVVLPLSGLSGVVALADAHSAILAAANTSTFPMTTGISPPLLLPLPDCGPQRNGDSPVYFWP